VELNNHFDVATSPAETWTVLMDIERVAPCMPGAVLDGETEDGGYAGRVKVKVGPIVTSYKGTVTFLERDEANHRAVLQANGKEAHGPGTAQATVVASLVANDSGGTRVEVSTDLGLTGKPAQFGRGVLSEVSDKLIGQFAANLAKEIAVSAEPAGESTSAGSAPAESTPVGSTAAGSTAAADGSAAGIATPAPTVVKPRPTPAEPEAIDLLGLAGGSVLRQLLPVGIALAGVVVGAVISYAITRRR
jgi:carbon monoxide dehydrogenase subunit G